MRLGSNDLGKKKKKKVDIETNVCRSILLSLTLGGFYQSKLKSREKSRHKTAALSASHRHRRPLLQICTFGCFASSFAIHPSFRCSPSVSPTKCLSCDQFRGCVDVWGMYVCVNVVNGGSMSSIRTAVNTAEIQLSLRGRTVLKGPGDGQEHLYLSPRMAYWLSSCKCCIDAPLVSSLPRFLCFTTSKVFSISLSLNTQTHSGQTPATH